MRIGDLLYKWTTQRKSGFFVDIGAYDGVTEDETITLENAGWDGICIEGNPAIFQNLKKNRKCKTYNAFVSDSNKIESVIMMEAHNLGSGIIDNFPKNGHVEFLKSSNHQIVEVHSEKLEDILEKFNAPQVIDLLKSDTEGSCIKIVKSLSFSKYIFKVISLELGRPNVTFSNFEEGLEFLKTKGYSYLVTEYENDIFIRNENAHEFQLDA